MYLDGRDNKVRRKTDDKPNENYARELMELHTLGRPRRLHPGRCARGRALPHRLDGGHEGQAVLGAQSAEARARADLFPQATGMTTARKRCSATSSPPVAEKRTSSSSWTSSARHPSTAKFIATKLCHRFVSYDPPEALVNRVAEEFTKTDGDIKSLLRVILHSDEFRRVARPAAEAPVPLHRLRPARHSARTRTRTAR